MLQSFVQNNKILLSAIGLVVAYLAQSYIRRRLRASSKRASYKNKIALITGASSGIGIDLAIQASRRGCHVLLVARNRQNLEAVADQCKEAGASDVTVCPCDVTKIEDISNLAQVCNSIGKKLGYVALNAGRGGICDFDESDDSEKIARDLMEINYFSNVNLVRKLLVKIKEDRADILVISSLSALLATAQRTQYSASKFAVQGFFNALRMELSPLGINISIICPGFVQTPFHAKVMTTAAAGGAPERKGHFMSSAECAKLAMNALESGDFELPMTLKGVVGYTLRPLLPSVVDMFAGKVAKGSLKK